MHSILENDGILSDPYEVLCSIGSLIIEGRTPKIILDSNTSCDHGETVSKSVKAYNEGPHCSNHMSKYAKDVHKCLENNILCIRYKNLRQHLQYLYRMSSSVTIEVSLGPDCLCGELRSKSTLVSTQPCKRDTVLEQWKINLVSDQSEESSIQMSVLNVYQAVRSLLHFSQLAAWYTNANGAKPIHVMYRVVVPEDATYITDDEFINHNLPIVNVNKTTSIRISLKTLPRKEKIPTVFCLQHSASTAESSSSESSKFEDSTDGKNYRNPNSSGSTFASEIEGDVLGSSLPLKFHGVRKKTNDMQERKRKKHITLYVSPTRLALKDCSGTEILDGMPVDLKDSDILTSKRTSLPCKEGESSNKEFKKSKPCAYATEDFLRLVEHKKDFNSIPCNYFEQKLLDPLVFGLNGLSDTRRKCDFRTKENTSLLPSVDNAVGKKTIIDILDDRMQISCAISGKHHCKWECEEESDLGNSGGAAEKPKRRRSLSRAVVSEGIEELIKSDGLEFEKMFHGKFRDIERPKENQIDENNERKKVDFPSCSKTFPSDVSLKTNINKIGTLKLKSLPLTDLSGSQSELDIKQNVERVLFDRNKKASSSTWIRKESFESFKKGCAVASNSALSETSSDDDDFSDSFLESSNPFLAAILRTTRKPKVYEAKCSGKDGEEEVKPKKGQSASNSSDSEEMRNPFKYFLSRKIVTGTEAKAKETCKRSKLFEKVSNQERGDQNFKSPRRKPTAVKGPKDLNLDDSPKKWLVFEKNHHYVSDEKNLKKGEKESDSLAEFNCNNAKTIPVPSAHDKLRFRRSLDTAAQLVFHRCSGLPLTSSPAPVRRNNNSFSFDSTLNSVSAIKSALFEPSNSLSSEDENESEGSLKSPASPGAWSVASKQLNYHSLSPLPLLGSFEESVLNGRLEPVSTVQGFTAELGASGSFCPRHLYLPVTVFFYTLGDNDKVSAPYLGHINLGKKGYSVPRSGTIQVTLFNPLRTVVKMFVVVYDLSDMPANSHTFLRQRTLYVPASQKESVHTDTNQTPFDQGDYHKYLRYLIHLRFVSGKTGRIYLHTDIRMVIFRKADEDTATALGKQVDGETYELRSHTHGPINPKFSPRK